MPQRRPADDCPPSKLVIKNDAELDRLRRLYETEGKKYWATPLLALNYFFVKLGALPPVWVLDGLSKAYQEKEKRRRSGTANREKVRPNDDALLREVEGLYLEYGKLEAASARYCELHPDEKSPHAVTRRYQRAKRRRQA